MKTQTFYKVWVSNGPWYSPSLPYQGTDKDLAVSIATAYIAKGRQVTITENEVASQSAEGEEGK